MPGERPYDPNLVEKVALEMREGTLPHRPIPTGPTIINREGFVPHPGKISKAVTAIRGLATFVASGHRIDSIRDFRDNRAETRYEKRAKRVGSVPYVAKRLTDTRKDKDNPAEKIGWVGYRAFLEEGPPATYRPENYTNLGLLLLDSKNPNTKPPVINKLRPTKRPVIRAERRLDALHHRTNEHRNSAEWISDSHGDLLDATVGHELSRTETRHFRKSTKSIKGHEKKKDKTHHKFERIATNEDVRGTIARSRFYRAERILNERRARAEERRARAKELARRRDETHGIRIVRR